MGSLTFCQCPESPALVETQNDPESQIVSVDGPDP